MDDLHQLIRELTPNEKRYIKQQFRDSEGRYGALFEAINAQKSPDEESLRQQFQAKAWFNNFSEAKRRLTELVFRGLRRFHDSRMPKFEVLNLLAEVEILDQKGQDHLLAQRLERAHRLAANAELPELEWMVLHWYPHLARRFVPAREKLPACVLRIRQLTKKLHHLPAYMRLSAQTHQIYRAYGYPCLDETKLQELTQAIAHARAAVPPEEGLLMGRYVIDFCDFMLHLMANQIEAAYEISCRTVERLTAQDKSFQAEKLYTTVNAFQAQIGLAMELQRYPQALHHLETFQKFISQPHLSASGKFLDKYAHILASYYQVSTNMYLGRAEVTETAVEKAMAQLKQLKQDSVWHIFLRLRIAMAAFSLGQYARAKAIIVSLQERSDVRPDVQNLLLMLRFMVDYELANFDQAEYLYRQGLRRLMRVGLDVPQDRRLMVHFRRLMTEREEAPEHFLELEAFLREILNLSQPVKTASEIKFLLSWAESQRTNRLLIDQFRQQSASDSQSEAETSLS